MNLDKRLVDKTSLAKILYIFSLFTGIIATALFVYQAKLISEIISNVFLHGFSRTLVRPSLIALFSIIIIRSVLILISRYLASSAAGRIMLNIRDGLIKKLLSYEPSILRLEDSVSNVNLVIDGVDDLEAYFSQYLPQLVYAISIPLMIVIFIFPLDKITAIIFIVTAPLIPIFMILIGNKGKELNTRQWTALSRLGSHFLDTLQGLPTLKGLNQEIKQSRRLSESSDEYRIRTMEVLKVTFLSAFVLEFIAMMGVAIVAVNVGLRLLYMKMNFQDAFFLLMIAPDFYSPLRLLGQKFHAGMAGVTAAGKIFNLLETSDEMAGIDIKNEKFTADIDNHGFNVSFENVHYRYPNREMDTIEGVSFKIDSGSIVALVGESGAGKSTIAGLLLKLIHPTEGRILVENKPLEDITTSYWRDATGWVPQKPHLFNDTIANNIRVGNREANDEEVIKAAEMANLHQLICTLPDGYQTVIGESAALLSGGEAQRIALARVFIKDVKFVIMDEPLTNLDVGNEFHLRESIKKLFQDRTLFIIAHYLPTVMLADQIIVLERGKVIEQGKHDELVLNNKHYSRILASHMIDL